MRTSGILLPVSSIPSPYGIGSFSESARKIVDLIAEAGQHYWQILPLGPTGYGDSPYQSFSAFAGNPYFIDLDALKGEGLLTEKEIEAADFGSDPSRVDYEKLYKNRFPLLRKAYERSGIEKTEDFQAFLKENADWLPDYALFMGIKNLENGVSWLEWPEAIRLREKKALEEYREKVQADVLFYEFLQYNFYRQWYELKAYANKKGVQIIGDIPIYCALDSADAWSHPELFQFDENKIPVAVAGCPPDAFSADGQLWGNPLYRWDYHELTGFAWWRERIDRCLKLYDVVRIDHFRGFDEYYSIPYGSVNAVRGKWMPGPGMKLFRTLKQNPAVTEKSIIAEDLGFMTPTVVQLVKDSGFPNMKVIEFAFDSREDSDYLPHNYSPNSVVYTGTHDNQTLAAWFKDELAGDDRQLAIDYTGLDPKKTEEIPWAFIRMALSSVSETAVIPMQDYLGLGAEARMNHPSTLGGNWCWRLKEGQFSEALAKKIRHYTEIFGRAPRRKQ